MARWEGNSTRRRRPARVASHALGGVGVVVVAMLAIDLGVLHAIRTRSSSGSARLERRVDRLLVLAGLLVAPPGGAGVPHCYLIEESLSVDNLFVFLVIFSTNVPKHLHHKVLFWASWARW